MLNNTKCMIFALVAAGATAALSPRPALACACGCGVFDVSTGTMLPDAEGGRVWLEYDAMTQLQNRSGTHDISRDGNDDKMIHSDFVTLGAQYMFSRAWGMQAAVPYANRDFKKTTDDPNPGDTATFNTSSFGDVRMKAIYTGWSEDMSTGATFGVKLPTGDFRAPNFDRDTQIGTGSTDLLIGGFTRGSLAEETSYDWFANLEWDQPVLIQDHYRPGADVNAAVGVYDHDFAALGGGTVTPILQLVGSVRMRDRGQNANPDNTGYERLLLSPAVEYSVGPVGFYGDVEVPVYQNVNGQQLTAPVLYKVMVSYKF